MKFAFLAAAIAAIALPAAAQVQTPGIDQRQAHQQERIQQGVQSGELSGKEAAHLEKGQARVQAMKDKAAADGKITGHERAKIARAQKKQSHRIAKKKHNRKQAS